MTKAYLIVQTVSFDYVRNVVLFIHRQLQNNFGPSVELVICDNLDRAAYKDGSLIFVIGENFDRHERRPGCRYVFLNFSVVEVLGNPFKMSRIGWSAIRRKKRMLLEKIDLYDVLLDYFPEQTKVLERKMDIPVHGFSIGVSTEDVPDQIPLDERPYDVNFVGGMTSRRLAVIERVKAMGLRVSPHSDVIFEQIAAQSRCTLNIHAFRSNHLETPRLVGAFACASPVVSERSYGLKTFVPDDLIVTGSMPALAQNVRSLLGDSTRLQDLQNRGKDWFQRVYIPSAEANWTGICQTLDRKTN